MSAQDAYLDIYTELLDNRHYLQSGSALRHSISDAIIAAATTATLLAFSNGFFSRLGEQISEVTVKKIRTLLHKSNTEKPEDAAIEALRLLLPQLKSLKSSTLEQRTEEEQWVADELREMGFPQNTSRDISHKVVEILKNSAPGDA